MQQNKQGNSNMGSSYLNNSQMGSGSFQNFNAANAMGKSSMETGAMGGTSFPEKAMVNDALASVNSSLTAYATVISQCSNPNLRQAIQQIRNNCETSQYELYKLAQSKGYYQPATMADDNEVQQIKGQLNS